MKGSEVKFVKFVVCTIRYALACIKQHYVIYRYVSDFVTLILEGKRLREERHQSGEKRPKNFFTAAWALFRNPTWDLITLACTVESGLVMAFATFLPKLLQFQYKLTASQAAMATGYCMLLHGSSRTLR